MNKVLSLSLLFCLSVFESQVGIAADDFATLPWQVGQWAAYQIEDARGKARLVELAIVGKKKLQGQDFFWCELRGEESGRSVIVKQLIARDRKTLRDVLVQQQGKAPFVLRSGSRVSLNGGEGLHIFFDWLPRRATEPRPVSVFAGHFSAHYYESEAGRFWFAPEVPITGLVKAQVPRFGELVLMAAGRHGARSALTGTPKPLQMPRLGTRLLPSGK